MLLRLAGLLLFLGLSVSGAVAGQAPPPGLTPAQHRQFQAGLGAEAERWNLALEGRMTVVLLDTDQPVFQRYVATGLLRIQAQTHTHLDTGLAAVFVGQGLKDGREHPVCYVLVRASRAGSVYRAFAQGAQWPQAPWAGYAFLMGHEVGHCLAHHTRLGLAGQKAPALTSRAWLVAPAHWAAPTTPAQARQQALAAEGRPEQAQVSERLADAMGALWTQRAGVPVDWLASVHAVRSRERPRNAHATAPVLEALARPESQAAMEAADSLAALWALAQQVAMDTVQPRQP